MQVYLLRHGIAEEGRPGKSDAERELTTEGRWKLRDTLRVAFQAEVKPSLMLTSPLKRAIQTADIAADILRYRGEIVQTRALVPNAPPEQVWDEIRVHRDESQLVLVGHDPQFTRLSGHLLAVPELLLDFKKGAMLRLDFEAFGPRPKGILRWFITPKFASRHSSKKRPHNSTRISPSKQ